MPWFYLPPLATRMAHFAGAPFCIFGLLPPEDSPAGLPGQDLERFGEFPRNVETHERSILQMKADDPAIARGQAVER